MKTPHDLTERAAAALWDDMFPEQPWDETEIPEERVSDFMGHARAMLEAVSEFQRRPGTELPKTGGEYLVLWGASWAIWRFEDGIWHERSKYGWEKTNPPDQWMTLPTVKDTDV